MGRKRKPAVVRPFSGFKSSMWHLALVAFLCAGCIPDVVPIADYGEAGEGFAATYCTARDAYFVVWHDSVSLTLGGRQIRAVILSPDGEILEPKRILYTSADSIAYFPMKVCFDDDEKKFFMVWTEVVGAGATYNVMGAFVSLEGTVGSPFLIGHDGLVRDLIYNQETGEYTVAIGGMPGTGAPGVGQRLSAAGDLLGDPFPLSRGGDGDGLLRLALNTDTNQYMAIAAADDAAGQRKIYGRIHEADGSPTSPWFTILTCPAEQGSSQDVVQAAYLASADHYVVYAQSLVDLGGFRFQATLGQKVSPSGTLLGVPFRAHIDLSALAGNSSPTPSLVLSPPKSAGYLFFDSLSGALTAQRLAPEGTLDGSPCTLALTYLVNGEFDVYPVQNLLVTADPQRPKALALWTRFLPPVWDMNLSGLIVDLF